MAVILIGNTDSLSRIPEVFFLPGVAGNLLAVYMPSDRSVARGENILVVPPFAEEMIRVRRMVSLQARRLSSIGVGTLVVDLFGTGDSEGEFKDATWDIWKSDVGTAIDWLKNERGDKVSLMGIRLGALLAMDSIHEFRDIKVEKTIFWQPVVSGEEYLREFLLLRVMAGMMQKAMPRVTLESLRARLRNNGLAEIAGYELSHVLADEVDQLRLGQLGTKESAPIHWIDLCAPGKETPKPVGQDIVDDWIEDSIRARLYTLIGFPFWAEWDVRVVDDMLDLTTEILGNN